MLCTCNIMPCYTNQLTATAENPNVGPVYRIYGQYDVHSLHSTHLQIYSIASSTFLLGFWCCQFLPRFLSQRSQICPVLWTPFFKLQWSRRKEPSIRSCREMSKTTLPGRHRRTAGRGTNDNAPWRHREHEGMLDLGGFKDQKWMR